MKNKIFGLISAIAVFLFAVTVQAATSTVVISENTSTGENQPGWMFARDINNATPYSFNTAASSIGTGSLYVEPLSSTPAKKFIAENFIATSIADIESISYDFLIGAGGTEASKNQFYVNVYANIDDSTNYYDCRFDYVATVGSTTDFTTETIEMDRVATTVGKRGTRVTTCPSTLEGMPEGSYIRAFSINVGDTTANDAGLDGYLDNVVVQKTSDTIIYDFEPATPQSKEECKDGGWMNFSYPTFKNQGQCISYVQSM